MGFKLFIMRHAKSDWSTPSMSDYDRPLNKRGRKNAKRMGQWMRENIQIPQVIVSSSAIRAKQTTELLLAELAKKKPERVLYEDDLYLASADKLIEYIQLYKSGLNSLMLVAHNPGLDQLVYHLSSQSIKADLNGKTVTTANLVIFEYPDSKFDPISDKGKLIQFIKPKELN